VRSRRFRPPTHPPPGDIPAGWRLRIVLAGAYYPNDYWRLEKPMDNGGWQGINPTAMRPGPQWETHIPLPAP
jgi:hypothetical protein